MRNIVEEEKRKRQEPKEKNKGMPSKMKRSMEILLDSCYGKNHEAF